MRQISSLVSILLAFCALSAPLFAGDHWILKPCGDGKGACFTPVSYPVYYKFEPAGPWAWGFGPQFDDGDGVPEGVILFPHVSGPASWQRIGPDGQLQIHYKDSDMPFLWCDARNFTDYYAWGSAIQTWGFNLALLDIVNDLTQVWTRDIFKDLRGCWVGKGHYQEESLIGADHSNSEAELVGVARNNTGKEFEVKMNYRFQIPRDAVTPDQWRVVDISFLSKPANQ
jgi:hypothetical protein